MPEQSNTHAPGVLLDEAAWAAFAARLRAYLRRRVEPDAVDDLAGEVMLRLVQHRTELAAARRPVAWMLRVAANALADHYRRRAAEQRALTTLRHDTAPPAPAPPPEAGAELSRCLVPMIQALPAPYGEALQLTDIEGLAQREAAERLGLSHSGMKSRVQRGRVKLKAALLRCCDIELNRGGAVQAFRRRGDCTDCVPGSTSTP